MAQLPLFAAALPVSAAGSLHWIPGAHRGRATLVRLFRWVPSFVFRDRAERPVTVEHGWWYCEDLTPARDARGVTRIQGVRPESFGASIEAELAPLRAEVACG